MKPSTIVTISVGALVAGVLGERSQTARIFAQQKVLTVLVNVQVMQPTSITEDGQILSSEKLFDESCASKPKRPSTKRMFTMHGVRTR